MFANDREPSGNARSTGDGEQSKATSRMSVVLKWFARQLIWSTLILGRTLPRTLLMLAPRATSNLFG
jgi:hypothetical protein